MNTEEHIKEIKNIYKEVNNSYYVITGYNYKKHIKTCTKNRANRKKKK